MNPNSNQLSFEANLYVELYKNEDYAVKKKKESGICRQPMKSSPGRQHLKKTWIISNSDRPYERGKKMSGQRVFKNDCRSVAHVKPSFKIGKPKTESNRGRNRRGTCGLSDDGTNVKCLNTV